MERRELTGYLLIFALIVVVVLMLVSAFKGEYSDGQVTVEQPRKVNHQRNNMPKDAPHQDKGQEMPWAGIM